MFLPEVVCDWLANMGFTLCLTLRRIILNLAAGGVLLKHFYR